MKRAFSKRNLWEKTPRSLKKVVGGMLSRVPLPLVLGTDFRRWYQFALEAEKWDADQIRDYQLHQLRRVLTLAYEKTDFYRDSFRSVGFEPGDLKTLEDLQKLPTIDKTTVRENWERMLTSPINEAGIDLVTTGGTSGEPLRLYMRASRHAPEFAHLTACWKRAGYHPGDSLAVLRGRLIKNSTDGFYHEHDPLLRQYFYSSFHMSSDALRKYVMHMHVMRPQFLHAYPSSLFALARFVLSEGMHLPDSIRAALVESEPLFPHQRDLVQHRIGLKVFSAYGLSEKVILAAECEQSTDLHVASTYGYCEIIGSDGTCVEPGKEGEMTGTGFIDQTIPLIRYRTGDDAIMSGRRCDDCGREQLLLKAIQPRRNQEFLVCRDGKSLISMTALNLHDDTLDGIVRFQFIQDQPGKVLLKLVTGNNGFRHDPNRIQHRFAEKLDGQIDLHLEFVDEIPLTRVGKQPLIVQRWAGVESLTASEN